MVGARRSGELALLALGLGCCGSPPQTTTARARVIAPRPGHYELAGSLRHDSEANGRADVDLIARRTLDLEAGTATDSQLRLSVAPRDLAARFRPLPGVQLVSPLDSDTPPTLVGDPTEARSVAVILGAFSAVMPPTFIPGELRAGFRRGKHAERTVPVAGLERPVLMVYDLEYVCVAVEQRGDLRVAQIDVRGRLRASVPVGEIRVELRGSITGKARVRVDDPAVVDGESTLRSVIEGVGGEGAAPLDRARQRLWYSVSPSTQTPPGMRVARAAFESDHPDTCHEISRPAPLDAGVANETHDVPTTPADAGQSRWLSRLEIKETIVSHLDEVRACYDRALDGWPDLTGRVEVRFVIDGEGHVAGTPTARSNLPTPNLDCCVCGALARWRFPTSGRATVVNYPFTLLRGGEIAE